MGMNCIAMLHTKDKNKKECVTWRLILKTVIQK